MSYIVKVFLIFIIIFQSFSAVYAQSTGVQSIDGEKVNELQSYPSSATGPHIRVSLLNEHASLVPNVTSHLGILLSPNPEWHTYWRNAGDSGEPPTVTWQSSADIEFGEIQWPLPEQIPVAHLVNYGYSGDTLLMVPITLLAPEEKESNSPATSLTNPIVITADLSWLVCKEDCIPGWATLSISLPTSSQQTLSEHSTLFENTRAKLPSDKWLNAQYEINEQYIALSTQAPYPSDWQLLPFRADLIQHSGTQQWHDDSNNEEGVTRQNVLLSKSDYFSVTNEPLAFLMTDGKSGYYVEAAFNSDGNISGESSSQSELDQSVTAIALMMFFAFLGGLILNIMPCVLPVLSIKALALANEADPKNVNHWGYLIGILISFWGFAAIVLTLKASGNAIGWGFHLQEPIIIAALSFLFVFIALMLWDVAPSGAGLAGMGQKLTQGNSFSSQFFTGVLAVIVASPCTAPFMATALGVAMVSPAITTILIFTALALGFALPMTLLAISPRFSALLPKPGNWMETFKQFLAFPMLATVIWLLWVFLAQTGSFGQLWLTAGLLAFALLIWLANKLAQKKSLIALSLAILTAGYVSIEASSFQAESPPVNNNTLELAFTPEKLKELKADEDVILVNMTADWCITCKVNEQVAFTDETLQQLLLQDDIHYVVGDWTNKNKEILDYLTQYQRSGVPLYVVYAGTKTAKVLPQVLTPSIVINAIQQAQQELNNATL